jgi:uncharacterized SAM-binding protein YcdF (DUF218 family)
MRISDDVYLKKIWDYLTIETLLLPADVIVVGGSNDPGTAVKAAELWKLGYAPLIVFSGYQQPGTTETEAESLAAIAIEQGVPTNAIIREPLASHTGQNIAFSKELLATRNITPSKVIFVHKPYMTRRFLAAAEAQWGDLVPEFMVTHQDVDIQSYYLQLGRGEVIRKMLGDFKRMSAYAKKGFQTPQIITSEVQEAYDILVQRGHQVR